MLPAELGQVLESVRKEVLWPMATRGRYFARCAHCMVFLNTQIDLYLLLWTFFRNETRGKAKELRQVLLCFTTHYKKLRALVSQQADLLERLEKFKISPGAAGTGSTMAELERKFEARLKE
jgi:hypothetical protein